MVGFWQKRQKAKLYKQWVEESGLSAENVPLELQKKRHDAQETEVEPLDVSQSVESNRSKRINYDDEVSLRI